MYIQHSNNSSFAGNQNYQQNQNWGGGKYQGNQSWGGGGKYQGNIPFSSPFYIFCLTP